MKNGQKIDQHSKNFNVKPSTNYKPKIGKIYIWDSPSPGKIDALAQTEKNKETQYLLWSLEPMLKIKMFFVLILK